MKKLRCPKCKSEKVYRHGKHTKHAIDDVFVCIREEICTCEDCNTTFATEEQLKTNIRALFEKYYENLEQKISVPSLILKDQE